MIEMFRHKPEKAMREYVIINGLKWDRENLEVDGQTHFTWDEAKQAAENVEKRLPTRKEFKALCDLGCTFDKEKNGCWMGYDHELKGESERSIFFPLAGYRYTNGPTLNSVGSYGYYWSATMSSTAGSYYLGMGSSGNTSPSNYCTRGYGFSVRCVAE